MLQLLCVYRSLIEHKPVLQVLLAKPVGTLLLNVLFPKLPSTLHVWG